MADDKPDSTRQTVELSVDEIDSLKVKPKPPEVPTGKPPTAETVEISVEDLNSPAAPPPPPPPLPKK